MNAVDTNILLYAHDPRDLAKQAVALSLLEERRCGAGFPACKPALQRA